MHVCFTSLRSQQSSMPPKKTAHLHYGVTWSCGTGLISAVHATASPATRTRTATAEDSAAQPAPATLNLDNHLPHTQSGKPPVLSPSSCTLPIHQAPQRTTCLGMLSAVCSFSSACHQQCAAWQAEVLQNIGAAGAVSKPMTCKASVSCQASCETVLCQVLLCSLIQHRSLIKAYGNEHTAHARNIDQDLCKAQVSRIGLVLQELPSPKTTTASLRRQPPPPIAAHPRWS